MSNQPQSVEGVKELKNKLVKFYWTKSLEKNGEINLDLVDGSEDFSIIPRINKRVDIEVGELRDIVNYTVDHFQRLLTHQQSEVLEKAKAIIQEQIKECSSCEHEREGEGECYGYTENVNQVLNNILSSLSNNKS